jgi:hypothetical protein
VNVSRVYDDRLLKEFDVLVIKTPTKDFDVREKESILRFVAEGGGLLLIGDHTNLAGSSARLNDFATVAGMRFRFDSVMDSQTGGYSYYPEPATVKHPASVRYGMEFMTSCSLALRHDAVPLLSVKNQVRQGHDYSNNSYFGLRNSDPQMDCGQIVISAVGRYGKGSIICFADSTVLSSFGVFAFQRAEMLNDFVMHLNRRAPDALPSQP